MVDEAKPTDDEKALEAQHYQLCADQTDTLVTIALNAVREAFPDMPEAATAGALMALVRFHVQKTRDEGRDLITRDVIVSLTPGLHRSAEQIVKEIRILDQVPLDIRN